MMKLTLALALGGLLGLAACSNESDVTPGKPDPGKETAQQDPGTPAQTPPANTDPKDSSADTNRANMATAEFELERVP